VLAWVQELQTATADGYVPKEVSDFAGDIYSMFFRGQSLTDGSLFNEAPPIWQNLAMKFCVGGTVQSIQAVPDGDDNPQYGIVYQSYMPNLYLYLDGSMVNETGSATSSPVQRGNFAEFSEIPDPEHDSDNAYGECDIGARGNGGNPWSIDIPLIPGEGGENIRPDFVRFCDDDTVYNETYAP
jgi:hypothetical protein